MRENFVERFGTGIVMPDEQKAELQHLVGSSRASGATLQEIRDAVNAKLEESGIEVNATPEASG